MNVLTTPIAFHPEECCGCTNVYFSVSKQELVAECNECGTKRQFLLNIEGGVIGTTVPFEECRICEGSGKKPRGKHCKLNMCVKKHDRITCSPNGVQCEHYISQEEPCECIKNV